MAPAVTTEVTFMLADADNWYPANATTLDSPVIMPAASNIIPPLTVVVSWPDTILVPTSVLAAVVTTLLNP